ncbi:MAG: hypothetical protein M1823_001824 [Watsoniomyces obsoletus]|nr:MAG: hypothetical protein M1823_001824 [Watsoniomyces obsoletus]
MEKQDNPSSSSTPESTSKSGIVTLSTGERQIPSSERPDGSRRKEIKIRPGYRPPEDIETYKNRTAQAWRTRGGGGVPGAAPLNNGSGDGGDAGMSGSKASNKNAKRREARKKAKAGTETTITTSTTFEGHEARNEEVVGGGVELLVDLETEDKQDKGKVRGHQDQDRANGHVEAAVVGWQRFASKNNNKQQQQQEQKQEQEEENNKDVEGTTPEKQARKIQKKLRQARELKETLDGGQTLPPEQREKVETIDLLVEQLGELGFDGEGKPKSKMG